MSTEPYTPDEVTVKAAWSEFLYLESHGMKHVDDSDAEFDRFINKVKADALREYATEMEANKSAQVWDHTDFAFDIRVWADEIEGEV